MIPRFCLCLCSVSSAFNPSTPIPNDRITLADSPAASAVWGFTHNTSPPNTFFSMEPSLLLQALQLGTVHRWISSGVVSGYQESGNT
jgi:hypothetical protein